MPTDTVKMFGCDIEEFDRSVESSFTFKRIGAQMVIFSLLSDSQEQIAMGDAEGARQTINRVKHLIHKHWPEQN